MMVEEQAFVVDVEGEFVWVERERSSSCGGCAANKGCGTATLQKVMGNKRSRIRAINPIHAKVGDQVVVGLEEQALLRGSLLAYIMPLIMMFLGALLFEAFFASEGLTIFGGIAGLAAGFAVLMRLSAQVECDARYQAVVLRHEPTPLMGVVKFDGQ